MLIGVRSSSDHYSRPYVYSSSERLEEYFKLKCGLSVSQFANGLECFCLSGYDGKSDSHTRFIS